MCFCTNPRRRWVRVYTRGSWQFTGLTHKYIIGLLFCVPWWWGWSQELHQSDKSFFCHLLSLTSKASHALKLACSHIHSILWGMKAATLIHRLCHLHMVRLHEVYEWHAQKTSSCSVFVSIVCIYWFSFITRKLPKDLGCHQHFSSDFSLSVQMLFSLEQLFPDKWMEGLHWWD